MVSVIISTGTERRSTLRVAAPLSYRAGSSSLPLAAIGDRFADSTNNPRTPFAHQCARAAVVLTAKESNHAG
jgi:hypothetical protein